MTARAPVVVRRVCVRVCAVSWSFGNQGVDWWLRLAMPVPTVWCVCPLSLSCAPRSVCGGVRFALPVLLEGSPWRPDVLVVLSPCRVVPCGCVRPAVPRKSESLGLVALLGARGVVVAAGDTAADGHGGILAPLALAER